jgi:hypothetical protein
LNTKNPIFSIFSPRFHQEIKFPPETYNLPLKLGRYLKSIHRYSKLKVFHSFWDPLYFRFLLPCTSFGFFPIPYAATRVSPDRPDGCSIHRSEQQQGGLEMKAQRKSRCSLHTETFLPLMGPPCLNFIEPLVSYFSHHVPLFFRWHLRIQCIPFSFVLRLGFEDTVN